MGGEPWFYTIKYQPDISQALHLLREREFAAGRYNPVTPFPQFPVTPDSPAPGKRHRSIAHAIQASDDSGTRSILDMERMGTDPDYGTVCPLDPDTLQRLFGTTQPTYQMVENSGPLFDLLERGQGVYIILYKNGEPDEIFFAGYSFD